MKNILMHMYGAAVKSLQSCSTLCDPIDGSPPSSPVPGILQARTLEWVAISFSNAWKWKVKVKSLNRVWLLATPWTAAYQAPPSMGFSRQKYWSGVPLPSPTGGKQEVLFLAPFYRQGSRGSVRLNLQLASQTWHSRLIPLIWSCAMSGEKACVRWTSTSQTLWSQDSFIILKFIGNF